MKYLQRLFSFAKNHKFISLGIILITLLLLFIFRPKAPAPIAVQKVEPTNLTQTVSVNGTIGAKNIANLTFPIGGTISWIGVKVGDSVTAGQTIATLDQRTTLKNMQQALIAYNEQRNTYDQTITSNNGISNPANALNDTMKRLLQNNQNDLDKTINSVDLQELTRQQAILSTPLSGIITRTDTTVAGTTAGPTTTFTVVDPNSIVFNMDVDEADIGKIQVGQETKVTLDAYPDETFSLPIDSIDFVSHSTTNGGNAYTVTVKLLKNTNNKFRVGMNGNADIITATRHNVLTIPLASLINNNQIYVKVGKKFIKKNVRLGLQSDTDAEVTSGLLAGDSIAIDPTKVKIK